MSYSWIRASEISDYVYCRHSFWLKRVRGARPRNVRQMQAGTRFHQQHGRQVRRVTWARKLAYLLLFLAIALIFFRLALGG